MPNSVHDRYTEDYDDEIDLAALALTIWNYRRMIAWIIGVLVVLVIVVSLFQSRKYSASTSIINMVDNSRVIKSVQQGFDFETAVQSPKNDILLAILESETLAVRVIEKAKLLPYLFPKRWDSEKKEWKTKFDERVPTPKMGAVVLKKKLVKIISSDKDPTITITVTTRNPELSPLIANTYTRELEEYLKTNSFSTVQKSRIFLEGKLKVAQKVLDDLKMKQTRFQQENGVFDLEQQAEASMTAYNELAIRLNNKETELEYIKSVASALNPRVQALGRQIRAIKLKMEKLKTGVGSIEILDGDAEQDAGTLGGKEKDFLPLNKVPELRMQLYRLAHDIEIQQKTNDLLIESYEKITIQEAKEKIFITVLDHAEVPLRPDSKGALIKLFFAVFGGGFFGICLVFALEFIKKQMEVRFDDTAVNLQPAQIPGLGVDKGLQENAAGSKPESDSSEKQSEIKIKIEG